MTVKLIGADDATGQNTAGSILRLSRWQAVASGNITEFKVKSDVSGNIKIAIYADNAGQPGALITAMNTGQAVSAGWNTLTFASTPVTSGTFYWMATNYDTTGACQYMDSAGWPFRHKAETYATFTFPDPPTGLSTANAYSELTAGWGAVVSAQTIYPSSIVQPISYGSPTVQITGPQTLLPSSIIQAIAYGTPLLVLTIKPSSIVQAISVGTPIVTQPQLYESYAEENAYYNVYGAYWRSQTFTPQSTHKITSVKLKLCRVGSPGTGTVSIKAADANGKPTGADLCSASIDGNSLPTDPTLLGFSLGAGANLNAGTKYAIVWRFPSGNSSNYARTRHMYPGTYTGGTAVTSSDSGSTWEVVTDWDFVFEDWGEPLMQTLYPDSIVQPVAVGSPIVYFVGTVYPASIVQQIAYGVPTILGGIPSGIIWPPSIVQQISIGSPTILKYVWHVVLDGNYITATPPTNRAYVIGRDVYGNPVYGTAVDATELGLVGERLDFQQELAIPTATQAEATANAILSKMRLTGKRGVILIPPNCGQELFDVVQLSDKGANQEAIKFRVVGIRFEYNPKQARYQHKRTLGAP
ncbi:MAG: hypothetical protein MUO24_08155 [Desulfobacterales bacterium]|nr:hypothetical protein [Desulfobacterales bacterium]